MNYVEPRILIRFVDEELQKAMGVQWQICHLPLTDMSPIIARAAKAIIVENEVNLYTLPQLTGCIAIWGKGGFTTVLRYFPWRPDQRVWYWGDLDPPGFQILSDLRAVVPQIQSVLMDDKIVAEWNGRIGAPWTGQISNVPAILTDAEQRAFRILVAEKRWIEQERFPQAFIAEYLPTILNHA